jgi:hypothetical protein
MFPTLCAYPGNFDYRVIDRETQVVRCGEQACLTGFKFGNLFAIPTN